MGVEVEILQKGNGVYPKPRQRVEAHYTGTLANGKKFDSSRDRNKPFIFQIGVGQVIKGWDEGMQQIDVGGRGKLTCSPDYAYGPGGCGDVIPPNATLYFDVEILGVSNM